MTEALTPTPPENYYASPELKDFIVYECFVTHYLLIHGEDVDVPLYTEVSGDQGNEEHISLRKMADSIKAASKPS